MDPDSLERLEITPSRLADLPIRRRPPLACYNRSRVTTGALIDQARRGLRVGRAVESRSLFWSTGPLGADRAIIAAAAGHPLTAVDHQALRRWLEWLSAANFNQQVFIEPNQELLVQGLMERRLDWIPCNSSNLSRLRVPAFDTGFHGPAAMRGRSPGRLCAEPLDPEHPHHHRRRAGRGHPSPPKASLQGVGDCGADDVLKF